MGDIERQTIKGYMKFLKEKLLTATGTDKELLEKELNKYKELFKTIDKEI